MYTGISLFGFLLRDISLPVGLAAVCSCVTGSYSDTFISRSGRESVSDSVSLLIMHFAAHFFRYRKLWLLSAPRY